MVNPQQHFVSDMNKYKMLCQYYTKLYASAGAYSNHVGQVYGTDCVQPNADADSRKRRLYNVSEPDFNQEHMKNIIVVDLDLDCDAETATESSQKEARYCPTDSESDAEGQ